ncbi:MAG: M67 family metallopeptidase [Saprospiraceae bacterium]|nr:M67 family metallopeptidase [Candidatus Opimibacter iunctus]
MSTSIDKDILSGIEAHLESAYPNEACGFLLGTQVQKKRDITHLIKVDNQSSENQRRRFVIDPLDYLKAERFATKEGLTLLGIYHSHPDHPAIPSVHDLEFAQPFFSYFIHTISEGKMTDTRSYRLLDGKFIEEKFTSNQYPLPSHNSQLTPHD